jgi:hypothetical protein
VFEGALSTPLWLMVGFSGPSPPYTQRISEIKRALYGTGRARAAPGARARRRSGRGGPRVGRGRGVVNSSSVCTSRPRPLRPCGVSVRAELYNGAIWGGGRESCKRVSSFITDANLNASCESFTARRAGQCRRRHDVAILATPRATISTYTHLSQHARGFRRVRFLVDVAAAVGLGHIVR